MKILNLIIESSLRYKYFTLAAAILSLAVGIWSWIDIRKEAYSDIADTQVRLVAKFPGKATLEVEERVTMPIERVLHSTPNLIVRRSRTITVRWNVRGQRGFVSELQGRIKNLETSATKELKL
ncbi:efflux RND transporter permease subunit [Leptospira santarosai]|uniref:RND transporter, hydrophobe/amphiphile efflux-1/heavy metal efflux family, permease protein n=1 Tax=Leptospira santarosai TaxID=28183 RepID=A0A2P1QU68_9LEPT|nr:MULTISPECIES: efflux RND transporter permease subunit [Leptospira]ASV10571.1 heavy metal RND transporter permease [Leptospira santarosai]AVQ12453.1 RND transporter, hydrophobe/amphiphile efflux-1/heavy metal efflux family, permease protein [Leptospira santarosai]EKO77768.1 RND transporter, hydrophobe/amphiphile efflux-1/heavy metal efflux family, permease protein [Leptospira sp. Fiocruz LV3954]EKS07393.1 RND transporter, Hydrophobe/Amphiphile Efflux-1 (HAE1)/Heavy Metal Efflux (HME) family, 